MTDYIFLMHNDTQVDSIHDWPDYLAKLRASGHLRGGSAIGDGSCFRKSGEIPPVTTHLGGFIRVEAESFAEAQGLLTGNPVHEAGGTVEIRELPHDG